jgi:outer membrane protein assembly factor BamE (lipoprotein component of BamABCDE complex)
VNGDDAAWAPPVDRRPSRRKVGLIIGALVLAIAVAGAVATLLATLNPPEGFERIRNGMTQTQVTGLLGVPDFRGRTDTGLDCWYYDRSITPAARGVCFRDGRVVEQTEP